MEAKQKEFRRVADEEFEEASGKKADQLAAEITRIKTRVDEARTAASKVACVAAWIHRQDYFTSFKS